MQANPLMLSMVASIFELRAGHAMPETVVELYGEATKAMLERAGEESAFFAPLLQSIFFAAHSTQQRTIAMMPLETAARTVANGSDALQVLLGRAQTDRMPLFSLLETRPLKLQAAHLSFQEFFAARAICDGAVLKKVPWELTAWWANTVRLGLEMGDAFGKGLLNSCGTRLSKGKSVRLTIPSPPIADPPTAARALGAALRAATDVEEVHVDQRVLPLKQLRGEASVDLSHSKLGDLDALVMSGFLGRDASVRRTLSLVQTRVTGEGAAALVRDCPSITRLDVTGMDDAALRAIGDALVVSGSSRLGSLKCDAFDLPVASTSFELPQGLAQRPGAVVLFAGALKCNGALEEIKRPSSESKNMLDSSSWCTIFSALQGSKYSRIVSLDLSNNTLENCIYEVGILSNAIMDRMGKDLQREHRWHSSNWEFEVGDKVMYQGRDMVVSSVCGGAHDETECSETVTMHSVSEGAMEAIAGAIRASATLTECNVRSCGSLDVGSAKLLAEAATEKRVMIFGTKHDQTAVDLSGQSLGPAGGFLIASDLRVSRALTSLDLSNNILADMHLWSHRTGRMKASDVSSESLKVGDKVTYQGHVMVVTKATDQYVTYQGHVKTEANGDPYLSLSCVDVAAAIAEGIEATASLTECNVRGCKLNSASAKLLVEAAKERRVMLFGIKPDQSEVDLSGQSLGPGDAILIANDVSHSSALTACNVRGNLFDGLPSFERAESIEAVKILTAVAAEKRVMLFGTKHEQTKVDLSGQSLQQAADITLIASDLSVSQALVSLDLSNAVISSDRAGPIVEGIKASAALTECNMRGCKLDVDTAKLLAEAASQKRVMLFGIEHEQTAADFSGQSIGMAEATLIASDVGISRALTSLNLDGVDLPITQLKGAGSIEPSRWCDR